MAALLCADVIANTNALTLSEKLQALWATLSEESDETVAIVAPAPQRPAADFATILHWEESDEDANGVEMLPPPHHNDAYLQSGGLYTQRLLARGRIMARYATEIDYMHAMSNPALVNQAPPWPPAPEHIADALTWGAPAHGEVAPHAYAPEDSDMETGTSVGGTSDDWSAPSFGWAACSQYTSGDEDTRWESRTSSLLYEGSDSEDECATGFFLGRDGTAWPIPPPECMPHDRSAEDLRDSDTASERGQPECWVVWSAEDDEHSAGSRSPGLGSECSAGGSEQSSTLESEGSWAKRTSPPATPPDVPLADLGLLWYTSFGKELGVSAALDTFIDDRLVPSPAPASFATDGFFLGRDGSLWPLPPSPPTSYTFDIRRRGATRYSSSPGPT
ncbi:hypothetical protein C8Q70DRAFT_933625 [Cubamyces menziesii]|uniref:Uncharacterized protein n=1 Tax=Trametes cubensis TaxID=1111947 RepID=A0AAD7TX00_9APHY|nr:hypothetical protein C8Q70DRAFT_933625 [Cubamyces menziesii]KAJ8488028.1 hypothetical protein ONZ51_g3818 [Trametes cubensis]